MKAAAALDRGRARWGVPLAVVAVAVLLSLALPSSASAQITITIVSGNNQTGTIGQPVPAPLVVQVTNLAAGPGSGPVPNFPVNWTVNGVFATVTLTGPNGQASFTFTPQAPVSTVVASSPNAGSVTFTIFANPPFDYSLSASPTTVTLIAGGAPGATTITATLLAGVTQPVSFSVSGLPGGVAASFSAPSCSPTCTTTLTLTAAAAAPAGNFTVTVTGSPLGRTVTFALTVNVARTLAIVSGNNQIGVINAPLPRPLVVSVTPANPPVTIRWDVTGGAIPSASLTPTVNGLAQITLTLGPTPSSVSVTASIVDGVAASAVTFVVNDATEAAVAGLRTYAVLGNLAVTTATVQARNIGIRLAALRRGGSSGVNVSGLSLNVAGQAFPAGAVASLLAAAPSTGGGAEPARTFGGLGIFLNGQGTFGDHDGTGREPGFTFHSEGLTLGADYRLSDHVVLGAAAGYLHTRSTLDAAGGRVKLKGYSVSAFGSYYESDRFYVDAIATYGWNDFDVTRRVTFADLGTTAKADPDGRQGTVSVSAGYNFVRGPLTVGPTARVNYIHVRIDGFEERGADLFNLRVKSQTVESLTTDLGVQLSYAISLPWGVLSPLARVEWEHEFKGDSRLISGSLVADPLRTAFGAPTNRPDRDYLNLAAGVTATLPRGASAFAHYEAVVGRSNVTTHSFTAGLRLSFD